MEYNINGIGKITPVIYRFPKGLYQNKSLNLERKLRDTNQLGAIRYFHNGAHYTRFEYVLLQYMLINFVQKNSEIGLGSRFNFKSWGIEKELIYEGKVSAAEVLELIVLYANMGHFKDTFSSNKVWFHYLIEDLFGVKKGLKKGLSSEGEKLLDKLIENSDYQKVQWLNALYMLSRTTELQDYRVICEKIVRNTLFNENDKWMDLYNKIRRVSYIVLDSHFSYIPIEISLQNVLFNHSLFIDEILKRKDYFCEYNYSNKLCPFILELGSKKTLNKLNLYIEEFNNFFPEDKDGLHELCALRHRLSNINYKGLIIVYAGSLRFIDSNKKSVCELDGLILTPKNKKKYLEVIEAKNLSTKSQRKSVAIKQLNEKFLPLVADIINEDVEIKELDMYLASKKCIERHSKMYPTCQRKLTLYY